MKLLIAPRHLDRLGRVEELLTQRGMACVRKTALNRMRNEELGMRNERVILLDTLGELDQYYALADLVFVGGSLVPIGGHNVLEVAAHRRPVFFGPYMSNFKEIADQLKGSGGGMEVSGGKEMGLQMVWLMQHSDEMKKRGESAYQVVLANRGAVMRNLEQVARWLEN
jgi:3-deoxy-D-manno-octulosonic-acid transferase